MPELVLPDPLWDSSYSTSQFPLTFYPLAIGSCRNISMGFRWKLQEPKFVCGARIDETRRGIEHTKATGTLFPNPAATILSLHCNALS
jgi:hypothetical protein